MMGQNENTLFTKTFTAASSDLSTYLDLGELPLSEKPTGNQAIGYQVLRVFAYGNNSGGTATLQLVCAGKDPDVTTGELGVIWKQDTTTCAATARRTDFNNNGSDYVCNVIFETSNNNMVDLLGCGEQGTKLYLGCTALTGFTSLTVKVAASRAV